MTGETERIVRLETQMAMLLAQHEETRADLKIIREMLSQAKGGWKTLMLVGGAAGAIGAALAKIAPWVIR